MSLLSTLSPTAAHCRQLLRQQIPAVEPDTFEPLALAIFRYQATHNPVYRQYLNYLAVRPDTITQLHRVPFMPISFFKSHLILTGFDMNSPLLAETLTFASSGTTESDQTSRHVVPDPDLYDAVSTRIFEQTYGPLNNLPILALLPSYLERNNSSLVYMVQRFMEQSEGVRRGAGHSGSGPSGSIHSGSIHSGSIHSGFYLRNVDELTERLRQLGESRSQPDSPKNRVLLIGVTFGLLDWAESGVDLTFAGQNPGLIVMETGGMKGRRKELLREEVHTILTQRLGIPAVHSEYGMTELLSQAYSTGNGIFRPGPTLRVLLRDINDPFYLYPTPDELRRTGERRTGGINVVDLANLDSCSFIETQDLGQYAGTNGEFRVIGRFDNSDIRGCNLMVTA